MSGRSVSLILKNITYFNQTKVDLDKGTITVYTITVVGDLMDKQDFNLESGRTISLICTVRNKAATYFESNPPKI